MTGRVVILGSVNIDFTAVTPLLPKPGTTVAATAFTQSQGGKGANQAVAAARTGSDVVFLGAVGTDALGDGALDALAAEGVDIELVRRVQQPTGVALVIVEQSGENEIVIVAGANQAARGRGFSWRRGDVAAAVLEVPVEAVEDFFNEARAGGAVTLLNAAPAVPGAERLVDSADIVCVNQAELDALGHTVGAASLIVTLGPGGARVEHGGDVYVVPGWPVQVVDTVGAGDTFCGVLAARLAAGRGVREAAELANRAAALSVTRAGARSSPTLSEIEEAFRGEG
ncbi:MAG TPA: ribokinase [Acidimicrobiales bacterium]|nr:ribokinase [Acidimicrobiales bacterium]